MMKRIKTWVKLWLAMVAFWCVSAGSVAQAQTYVRPSKGTPLVILPQTTIGAGAVTYTSAVYDMSAFSEAQLTGTLTTSSPTESKPFSWTAVQFGRYIRLTTITKKVGVTRSYAPTVSFRLQTAEQPNGPFVDFGAPGAQFIVTPDTSTATLETIVLGMTPIPFQTQTNIRPSKGDTMLIYSGEARPGATALDFYSPVYRWDEFAAIAISGTTLNPDCPYEIIVEVYGSASADMQGAEPLQTRGSRRTINESNVSYALSVDAPYIRIRLQTNTNVSKSGPCGTYWIYATPLPYAVAPETYGASSVGFGTAGISTADGTVIALQGRQPYLRLQNSGTVTIGCSTNINSYTSPAALGSGPIHLKPASALSGYPDYMSAGDGGVVELRNLLGNLRCRCLGTPPFGGACRLSYMMY